MNVDELPEALLVIGNLLSLRFHSELRELVFDEAATLARGISQEQGRDWCHVELSATNLDNKIRSEMRSFLDGVTGSDEIT